MSIGATQALSYNTGLPYSGMVLAQRRPAFYRAPSPVLAGPSYQAYYARPKPLGQTSVPIDGHFVKEAAKLGAIVGISIAGELAGGLPGAMIAGVVGSTLLSLGDQWLCLGKIDWQRVAVDGVTGLVPAGAGSLVHQAMHLLASKAGFKVPQNLLMRILGQSLTGAVDGAAMGYVSGAVSSGFFDYRQQGCVHINNMNHAGLQMASCGAAGGAVLGSVLGIF